MDDPDWARWLKKKKYHELGERMKKLVADVKWWKRIKAVLKLCAPVMSMLRMVDGPAPCISKVYFNCYQLQEHFSECKAFKPEKMQLVKDIFSDTWEWLHSPLHAAGFLLDPEYHAGWADMQDDPTKYRSSIEELIRGRDIMFQRLTKDADSFAAALMQFGMARLRF
ncbi:hypothetical protein DUNSADRAFT_4270 [Dunaliella salina]|uniref:Uncharacterized protein n=1 Tax=Dunaliella salina TaxID=3046 RepID=A0ABQ7FUV4_DUNSA|nr:hypothetical protein DUNSADRAFT_4270 [Dunaliella salina]|eukprot:KAF5826185.1 hypothetical protein DUNSADRAFT_4270 [Dunaliella salina]